MSNDSLPPSVPLPEKTTTSDGKSVYTSPYVAIPAPPPSYPGATSLVQPLPGVDIANLQAPRTLSSSGSTVESTFFGTSVTSFHYTLVIQVPVPFFNLNIGALVGGFVMDQLAQLGVPQAIDKVIKKIEDIIGKIIEDVQDMIKAIPFVQISIQVRVGSVSLVNVVLIADKVPVTVAVPTFDLALPNFDFSFPFVIPFPSLPPVFIRVPVPVPTVRIPTPLLTITGGNVTVSPNLSTVSLPLPLGVPSQAGGNVLTVPTQVGPSHVAIPTGLPSQFGLSIPPPKNPINLPKI